MEYRQLGKTRFETFGDGFRRATLGSVFRKTDEEEGKRAVVAAIERGINYFDTAPFYGIRRGETVLGEALKGHRDKVILSTKLGRYGSDEFDFSRRPGSHERRREPTASQEPNTSTCSLPMTWNSATCARWPKKPSPPCKS